ncbi:MAG: DotU family type IV/VI secretion system protein [Deltaproteobacteria bacterium]|nr:DotU family type IV/VI secretion system protein [Deltaproteobacteria bacterium]
MAVRLIDYFTRVVAFTQAWQKKLPKVQPAIVSVQADYETMFTQAQEEVRLAEYSAEDYDLARFAVVAYIDETIMLSDWVNRDAWAAQSLQLKYYETTNAGKEFFIRLNDLPESRKQVREVYLICLSLGFSGIYFGEDQHTSLEQIKKSGLETLWADQTGDIDFSTPFPQAYPSELTKTKDKNLKWGWGFLTLVFLILPPALFISLFVMFRLYLYKIIDDFIRVGM